MQPEVKNLTRSKTKQAAAAKGTSQAIAEQTRAFLKAGGQITKIRSGTRDQETATDKEQSAHSAIRS
jgi:hypothetical protein